MKEKLHFEITIPAPVQKVWDTMLGQESYKQWTSVFEPTSYYDGSWEKGSKIKFLGSGGSGMVSEIAENIPNKYISIRHLGEVKDGVEDTTSDQAKNWNGAYENNTFTDKGNETLLEVDIEMQPSDIAQSMKQMFAEMWPMALLKLKEIVTK